MNSRMYWKEFLLHLMLWLLAEIILNLTELSDLSNYSEFVLQQNQFELRRA